MNYIYRAEMKQSCKQTYNRLRITAGRKVRKGWSTLFYGIFGLLFAPLFFIALFLFVFEGIPFLFEYIKISLIILLLGSVFPLLNLFVGKVVAVWDERGITFANEIHLSGRYHQLETVTLMWKEIIALNYQTGEFSVNQIGPAKKSDRSCLRIFTQENSYILRHAPRTLVFQIKRHGSGITVLKDKGLLKNLLTHAIISFGVSLVFYILYSIQ